MTTPPLGLRAVTVTSPCSGCSMSVSSPTMSTPLEPDTGRRHIYRFTRRPHPGCSGGGTFDYLEPIFAVYLPVAAPARRRRWWRR